MTNFVVRIRCLCGAPLLVRSEYAGHRGRCPACRAKFRLPSLEDLRKAAATSESALPDRAPGASSTCGICQSAIEPEDEVVTCSACVLPFHPECWEENQGCSAYGCSQVGALKPGPDLSIPPALPPLSPQCHTATFEPISMPSLGAEILFAISILMFLLGIPLFGAPSLLWAIATSVYLGTGPDDANLRPAVLSGLVSLAGFIAGLIVSIFLRQLA